MHRPREDDRSPSFSVVIPTYNRAPLLPRALRSVLGQTFEDFELLVVDDASTDDTTAVVAAHQDRRISYLRLQENGGVANARNAGIAAARGTFVCFLDDDDEYLPEFRERTWETLEDGPESVGLAWCGVVWAGETQAGESPGSGEIWRPEFDSREAAYLGFLADRRIGTNCGLTLRRSSPEGMELFDPETDSSEDTDFLIRFVGRVDFAVVPHVLVRLHRQEGSLRSDAANRARAYRRILAKHRSTLAAHPRLDAALHYKAGWLHLHAGESSEGRRLLRRSLRLRPLQPKALGMLLLSGLGGLAPGFHTSLSALRKRRRARRG